MWMRLLVVASMVFAGCASLAVSMAPKKEAKGDERPLAKARVRAGVGAARLGG